MKTELKEGIFIEGFDTHHDWGTRMDVVDFDELRYELLYAGETSSIPENVAKECVRYVHDGFKNYYMGFNGTNIFDRVTAKESIQTACDKKYCIIYKLD